MNRKTQRLTNYLQRDGKTMELGNMKDKYQSMDQVKNELEELK